MKRMIRFSAAGRRHNRRRNGHDLIYGDPGANNIVGGLWQRSDPWQQRNRHHLWSGGDDQIWGTSRTTCCTAGMGSTRFTVPRVMTRFSANWASIFFMARQEMTASAAEMAMTTLRRLGQRPLQGEVGNDQVEGTMATNTLEWRRRSRHLWGGNGFDNPDRRNRGRHALHGGEQDDLLEGGWGDDKLYGENGNDRPVWTGRHRPALRRCRNRWPCTGNQQRRSAAGDAGPDRFLFWTGTILADFTAEDGQLRLINATSNWTKREISVLDAGWHDLPPARRHRPDRPRLNGQRFPS